MTKKVLICDICGREIKTNTGYVDEDDDYAIVNLYCMTSEGYVEYHKDICIDCYLDKLNLPKY